jgi:hypothetical protein
MHQEGHPEVHQEVQDDAVVAPAARLEFVKEDMDRGQIQVGKHVQEEETNPEELLHKAGNPGLGDIQVGQSAVRMEDSNQETVVAEGIQEVLDEGDRLVAEPEKGDQPAEGRDVTYSVAT